MATAAATPSDFKDAILAALEIMRKKEVADKQPFKARAYKKAMEGLALLPAIRTFDDVAEVPGIGDKIEKKIREILDTGRLASAERAAESHAVHEELMAVYGIGPSKATELIMDGIVGVEELRKAIAKDGSLLNDKQKIGLKFYEDLKQRIPRSEMLEHENILQELLPEGVDVESDFQIVGSFRREAPNSGDIDVLIRCGDGVNAAKVLTGYIKMLEGFGYLLATLAHGDKKFMGICQLPGHPARRLDILMTPAAEYPYAVLYFTGSDTFNIAFRHWALEKGYTLNEHTLTPLGAAVGAPPIMNSERDIFRFLGLQYIPPVERKNGVVLKPIRRLKVAVGAGVGSN